MRAIFWFLLLVLAVLFGVYIFRATYQRLGRSNLVLFEVVPESIKAFEERVEKLERDAALLCDRLGSSRLMERDFINRRIALLEQGIQNLKTAVAKWRTVRDFKSAAEIYRNCLLLYGKAAGVCELLATDTLPPTGRHK